MGVSVCIRMSGVCRSNMVIVSGREGLLRHAFCMFNVRMVISVRGGGIPVGGVSRFLLRNVW